MRSPSSGPAPSPSWRESPARRDGGTKAAGPLLLGAEAGAAEVACAEAGGSALYARDRAPAWAGQPIPACGGGERTQLWGLRVPPAASHRPQGASRLLRSERDRPPPSAPAPPSRARLRLGAQRGLGRVSPRGTRVPERAQTSPLPARGLPRARTCSAEVRVRTPSSCRRSRPGSGLLLLLLRDAAGLAAAMLRQGTRAPRGAGPVARRRLGWDIRAGFALHPRNVRGDRACWGGSFPAGGACALEVSSQARRQLLACSARGSARCRTAGALSTGPARRFPWRAERRQTGAVCDTALGAPPGGAGGCPRGVACCLKPVG